jgi:hypothetical protein
MSATSPLLRADFASVLDLAKELQEVALVVVYDGLRAQQALRHLADTVTHDLASEIATLARRASDPRQRFSVSRAINQLAEELRAGEWEEGCRVQRTPASIECDPDDESEQPSPRFRLYDDFEIELAMPPTWLVDGLLPEKALIEIHGSPASGKSFWALNLALSIASGRPFVDRSTKQGTVVIVAAEGAPGLGKRIKAWKRRAGLSESVGVRFVTEPVNLMNERDVREFISALRELDDDIRLVIFDTLALCFAGGDENSAKDVGLLVAGMHTIRRAFGAAVMVVHHTNANGDRERGCTALRGAMDTMVAFKRKASRVTVICAKQKDAEEFDPIELELVTSCDSMILAPARVDGAQGEIASGSLADKALRSLHDSGGQEGLSSSDWLSASDMAKRTFYKYKKELEKGGYVQKIGKGIFRLSPSGRNALAASCTATAR